MSKEEREIGILPKCRECGAVKAAASLVGFQGKRICLECAEKVVPGGIKNIWQFQA